MVVKRVLVARPQTGADATAARLEGLGFEPILLPLTEIKGLAVSAPSALDAFDAVAVTSANALRHMPKDLLPRLLDKKCFAVGGETGIAVKNAGFRDIVVGTGDAAGLVRIILGGALPSGSHVLHLCGRVRVSGLADGLREGGMAITELETYDAPVIHYAPETILAKLGGVPLDAALVHSAKAALRLSEVIAWQHIRPLFADTRYFCLSSRIGAALADVSKERIFCASTPEEAELLALLRQHMDG